MRDPSSDPKSTAPPPTRTLMGALGAHIDKSGLRAGSGTMMRFGTWGVQAFRAPLQADDFTALDRLGATAMIEWVESSRAPAPDLDDLDRELILLALISTGTAFRLPVAQLVAPIIEARWPGGRCDHEAVLTALGEAITNAVVHGNLGMKCVDGADPMGFDAFMRAVAERIAAPEHADKLIIIAAFEDDGDLIIMVRDQGEGFDPSRLPTPTEARSDPRRLSGRGVMLMRDFSSGVTFARGGRQVTLRFASRPPRADQGSA